MITDFWFYAAAIPAVLLAGISKAGLGAGLGILSTPLIALTVSPAQAAAVMLPILCLMDLLGLYAFRGQADLRLLRWLLPGALVGIVAGALVFEMLDARWVKGILGVECLLFATHRIVTQMRGAAPAAAEARVASGVFWGGVSGFTSTIAHAGGPPLMQFLLPLRLDKRRFVGTTVFFFTAVNYVKLIPYATIGLLDFTNLATSAALVPVVPLGYWLGLRLLNVVPERAFYRFLTASLLVTGAKLCWDAFAGT